MVRFAEEEDLDRVKEMQDRAGEMLRGESSDILVAERDGVICGMAGVEYLTRPESPYCLERKFYHVVEFGVDEAFRRRGVGRELMEFIRKDARERGFARVELDVWEFNQDAVQFYEAIGFQPFRRFLEWDLEDGK